MNPKTTIAELLRLWPRLPDLAGAHWPAMYWQLDTPSTRLDFV